MAEVFDGPHATPVKTEEGPWFLSISSLISGRLELSESAHLSEQDFKHWTRRVTPSPGDILFSYETRLGEAALMPGGIRAALGRRMGLLRPRRELVEPRFLLLAYLSPDFQQVIQTRKIHGATVDRIPLVELPKWPIRIPELSTQRRISAVLGALDDKIAVNDRIAATLDDLSHVLFSKHFSPAAKSQDWQTGKLSDLCGTQYGYTASSTDASIGPRLLRVKDINKENWIDWPNVPYCQISADKFDKYRLGRGDIVVARMADPGKSAIVEEDEEEAVFASYLVRLKTASLTHAYFVWGFLKSERYQDYVAASKSGSVQSNMNAKAIVGASLDIPPQELMQKHFEMVDPLRQKLLAVLRESRALVALRDQLLPELMSGRLQIREVEKVIEEAV
ncbi:restriction endonuclease subunit S [Micromonospora sp. HUAS YX12]|uniref:Restriction endonuclease subunit S n=1 Tax=Micromonospora sp. HUAS YX12 TaxID=3156396 RepID=A0AAU7QZ37_9ACTN